METSSLKNSLRKNKMTLETNRFLRKKQKKAKNVTWFAVFVFCVIWGTGFVLYFIFGGI